MESALLHVMALGMSTHINVTAAKRAFSLVKCCCFIIKFSLRKLLNKICVYLICLQRILRKLIINYYNFKEQEYG